MQADIKAAQACGAFAAGALTCIVDENTLHVKQIHTMPVDLVVSQIHSFLDDVGAECVKTGALVNADIVKAVGDTLAAYRPQIHLLVDPVMVNSGGEQLIEDNAIEAYKEYLFPIATIITPNMREAELLLGHKWGGEAGQEGASPATGGASATPDERKAQVMDNLRSLSRWGNAVVVKSVPCEEGLCDFFYDPNTGDYMEYTKCRIDTKNTNGTGDSFASSIAAYLSRGFSMPEALERAEDFIQSAIFNGSKYKFGSGYGPVVPEVYAKIR